MAVTSSIYRISYIVTDCGRNIRKTKRCVRWRFGFVNDEALSNGAIGRECCGDEHEVKLIWSITSGKQKLVFNKNTIYVSKLGLGARQRGRFSLQWKSLGLDMKINAYAAPPIRQHQEWKQFDLIINGQSFDRFSQIFQLGLESEDKAKGGTTFTDEDDKDSNKENKECNMSQETEENEEKMNDNEIRNYEENVVEDEKMKKDEEEIEEKKIKEDEEKVEEKKIKKDEEEIEEKKIKKDEEEIEEKKIKKDEEEIEGKKIEKDEEEIEDKKNETDEEKNGIIDGQIEQNEKNIEDKEIKEKQTSMKESNDLEEGDDDIFELPTGFDKGLECDANETQRREEKKKMYQFHQGSVVGSDSDEGDDNISTISSLLEQRKFMSDELEDEFDIEINPNEPPSFEAIRHSTISEEQLRNEQNKAIPLSYNDVWGTIFDPFEIQDQDNSDKSSHEKIKQASKTSSPRSIVDGPVTAKSKPYKQKNRLFSACVQSFTRSPKATTETIKPVSRYEEVKDGNEPIFTE